MDTLAHALWARMVARAHNHGIKRRGISERRPISVGWATWWGIFPDLMAFGIPIILSLYFLITGDLSLSVFADRQESVTPALLTWAFELASEIYNVTHSFVIFFGTVLVVALITKRIPWELFGWGLHIFFDIPTHTIDAFPTPFLWPLSEWRFPYGISWASTWFMIINYSTLLVLAWVTRTRKERK